MQNGMEERGVLKPAKKGGEGVQPRGKEGKGGIRTASMEIARSRASGRDAFWVPMEERWKQ